MVVAFWFIKAVKACNGCRFVAISRLIRSFYESMAQMIVDKTELKDLILLQFSVEAQIDCALHASKMKIATV